MATFYKTQTMYMITPKGTDTYFNDLLANPSTQVMTTFGFTEELSEQAAEYCLQQIPLGKQDDIHYQQQTVSCPW